MSSDYPAPSPIPVAMLSAWVEQAFLRAGLSAGVEIDTRQRRHLLGFSL